METAREQRKTKERWISSSRVSGHLLVVEDDVALKPLWEHFIGLKCPLIEMNWTISAETAIEMLKPEEEDPPFDVIVVDIFLSGSMTGLDVLEAIRSTKWQNKCEVILSSACDPLVLKQYTEGLSANTWILPKPYLASNCMSSVLEALEHKKCLVEAPI